MNPDPNKQYIWKQVGTGHTPHMFENAGDPNDKIWPCSCGGSHNPDGTCDGSHGKKQSVNCNCPYCQSQEERVKPKTA